MISGATALLLDCDTYERGNKGTYDVEQEGQTRPAVEPLLTAANLRRCGISAW
jgi:hypothetical protein